MRRSNTLFALTFGVLPLAGCSGEGGGFSPELSGLGSLDPRLASGSKEMQALGGGLKMWSALSMSDEDAKQIGEATAVAIVNQPEYRLSTNDALNRYVTKVGLTIAAVSPRTDIDYTFGVLESDSPNAFSMPGGYIFITRGALFRMQDEAELAGVLAHEIGHICKEHGKNTLKGSKLLEGALQAGSTDQRVAQFAAFTKQYGKDVVTNPFSQGDENAADAEAIKYVKLAGYDPAGLARYLNRVNTGGSSGGWFRTHPITADRVKKIQGYAAGASGATLKERFAANVK